MILLDFLATKYGTDKKSTDHCYTPIYEHYLREIRHGVKSMLEVGVNDARSIKMWEDYFPNAIIYGVDMSIVAPVFPLKGSTVIYEISQEDSNRLTETFRDKRLDVVVDDASHDQDKTLKTFNTLMPLIVSGGHYFIEDLPWIFVSKISDWLYQNRSYFGNMTVHTDKGLTSTLIAVQKA